MRNLEIDARQPAAKGSCASDRCIGDGGHGRRRGDNEQCDSATYQPMALIVDWAWAPHIGDHPPQQPLYLRSSADPARRS
jgi:hypothetical protein